MKKEKIMFTIIVLALSFIIIKLGFGAEVHKLPSQPTMIEGVTIEQTLDTQKTIVVDADLKVKGELKVKSIKSRTTDGLVFLGYLNLVLLLIVLL